MKYAVNMADLTVFAQNGALDPVMLLVKPVLSEQTVMCAGDRWDEIALLVRDDLQDGRFEAIHKIVRSRIPKHRLRIYRSKTGNGGWSRI